MKMRAEKDACLQSLIAGASTARRSRGGLAAGMEVALPSSSSPVLLCPRPTINSLAGWGRAVLHPLFHLVLRLCEFRAASVGASAVRQRTTPHQAERHAGAPAPSPSRRCCADSNCNAQKGYGEHGRR